MKKLNLLRVVSLTITILVMIFMAGAEFFDWEVAYALKETIAGFNLIALVTFVYASLKRI